MFPIPAFLEYVLIKVLNNGTVMLFILILNLNGMTNYIPH